VLDDRLIDDVARELTAAEPHSTLRARVTSALDGKRQSVRWRVIAPAAVAAGAAFAIAVNALLAWQTRSQPVPAENSVRRVAAPGAPLADAETPRPAQSPVAGAVAVSRPRRATSPEAVAPTAEELAWQLRAVPPLAPPASPALGVLQPADAVAPLLDVTPLVTEPLELAPLDQIDPVATGGA
jgi:hypothetical protein